MFPNAKFQEEVAVLAAIDPQSAGSGYSISTDWLPLANFNSVAAFAQIGAALTGVGNVSFSISVAQDATGTNAHVVKTTGNVTNGAEQVFIEVSNNDIAANAAISALLASGDDYGFGYVQFTIAVTGETALVSGLLLGVRPRSEGVSSYNASSVVQVI